MVIQNRKSCSFRVRRVSLQGSVLGPVLFFLFIDDLSVSLLSSVSCSLYADHLAIWSSSLSVPVAVEATQGALIQLERWYEYWCLHLNPSKCEASSQWISSKLTSSPTSFFIFCLRFNPTPTFLGVTFDYTLSFSKHVSSLKAKFFPHLKALRCISASTWCSFKESLSVLYKGFLQPLHLCFTRIVSFVNVTNRLSPKWNAFTERLVAPSPAIDLLYPTSLRRLYLSYESH